MFVKNIADTKETKPINKNNIIDLTILLVNKFFSSLKINGKKIKKLRPIKKSSSLIETYVPTTLNTGNFGYSGITIKSAIIKNLYRFLDGFKSFCIYFYKVRTK